jgi:hypothetical protein
MGRPLDHLVLASHDLNQHAALFRRLGFEVGARNQHPWGTENHIVQFDRAFLELIGLGQAPNRASASDPRAFTGFLARYLQRRDGFAMLVLRSDDARQDRALFNAAKIGTGEPFVFSRRATRPDQTTVEVAFTLAFAQSPLIDAAGFFVCQQHFPQNFWNPLFQRHDNGAQILSAVTLVAPNPADHLPFLQSFANAPGARSEFGWTIDTGGGRLDVLTPAGFQSLFGEVAEPIPYLAAFEITVAGLDRVAAILHRQGIETIDHSGRLIVPSRSALGCTIAFAAERLGTRPRHHFSSEIGVPA